MRFVKIGGVVRDAGDAVELEGVRRRLDHRRPALPFATIARSVAWSSGAPGVVTWASWRTRTVPDPRLHRADEPGAQARGLERGRGEERGRRLAVGARDADRRRGRRDGSSFHHAAAAASAGRAAATTSWGSATPGHGLLDDRRRRARVGRRLDELDAVDVEPGDGDEQRPLPDLARVLGHAADRDRREGARPRRAVVDAGAAHEARGVQALRGGRPAAAARSGARRGDEALDRIRRRARSPPAPPPREPRSAFDAARPAAYRHAADRPAPAPRRAPPTRRRTTACARTARRSARPAPAGAAAPATSTPPRSISVRPSASASSIARQRRRCIAPGWSRRRSARSPECCGREPPAVAVQDEPAEHVAVGRTLARLEVDEVPGRERPAPPRDELAGAAEREAAPVAGRAQQPVEAVERRRRRPRPREPCPRARSRPRPSGRRTTPSRSARRIRWRVALAMPSSTACLVAVRRAAASAIRWRDGWISAIGMEPRPRRARRAYAGVAGRDLGVRRDHVDAAGRRPPGADERGRAPRPSGAARPSEPATRASAGIRPGHAAGTPTRPAAAASRARATSARCVADREVHRAATRRRAVLGPGPGLEHVAARDVDRLGVPAVEPSPHLATLAHGGHARGAVAHASAPPSPPASPPVPGAPPPYPDADPPPRSPWRIRSTRTRARCATAYVRRPNASSTRSYAPT